MRPPRPLGLRLSPFLRLSPPRPPFSSPSGPTLRRNFFSALFWDVSPWGDGAERRRQPAKESIRAARRREPGGEKPPEVPPRLQGTVPRVGSLGGGGWGAERRTLLSFFLCVGQRKLKAPQRGEGRRTRRGKPPGGRSLCSLGAEGREAGVCWRTGGRGNQGQRVVLWRAGAKRTQICVACLLDRHGTDLIPPALYVFPKPLERQRCLIHPVA
jgi:hypothetical protein